ncbi:hypothetical protein ACN20G_32955 (plasmid) [Streptomyces sp. BI20]|uniref:hypothetical protein n=1 Tax=Streptomyces sp. BI20 TaxID=3403460 RepID=UPI003C741C1C
MTTTPRRYTVHLVPEHLTDGGTSPASAAVRTAVVEATGELGVSGYPRYAGEGLVAEIDARVPAVEALLVDGAELDYGLRAIVLP